MKLNVGDKVKFLNEKGEGKVSGFLNDRTAVIETNDGFEIPVLIKELVISSGQSDSQNIDSNPQVKNVPEIKGNTKNILSDNIKIPEELDEQILLGFLIKEGGAGLFVYLLNNSSFNLYYLISENFGHKSLHFDHGELESGVKMRIKKFMPENIGEIVRFDVQIILFKSKIFEAQDPVHKTIFINPSEIFSGKLLTSNEYFDKKAAIFVITDLKDPDRFTSPSHTDLINIVVQKPEKIKEENIVQNTTPKTDGPDEVDLHIEAIMDNYSGLSNGEILEIQMARFKTSLETAIIHKDRRIVFIHGVGNGKLKYSIRKTLEEKYPDLKFQDASFREYGYGATMVIIP